MFLLCALLLGSLVASASAGDSARTSAETTCSDQTTLWHGFDDAFLMESDDDEDSPSDNTPTSILMSGNGITTSAKFGALDKDDSKVDLTTSDGGDLIFQNVKGYGQVHSKKIFVGETTDGSATLDMIKKSTGIYASIVNTATNTVTQIGHDSNGNTVVSARNTNDYPEDAPFVESGKDDFLLFEQGLHQVDEHELADDGSIIDVMVIWTHHAECSNSRLPKGCTLTAETEKNMKGLIQLAIQESNTAFDLSTVNTNFRLVHAYRDPSGYDESAGFSDALNKVTGTTDGVMDGVHAERDKYRADVVALIISNDDDCGLGWIGPSKSHMFSVTHWDCATGYYSFVHEIMHNFGCHHDRGTQRACSSSSSSDYGYCDPDGEFRTIMAYNCRTGQCDNIKKSGCTRIQRVSNPTTKYEGKPVGSAVANNAKRINDVRKIVAQYYNSCSKACHVPPENFPSTGKACPAQSEASCLNSNTPYNTFAVAWKQCGQVSGCGFIMKWRGKYYLRRSSDPEVNEGQGIAFPATICSRPASMAALPVNVMNDTISSGTLPVLIGFAASALFGAVAALFAVCKRPVFESRQPLLENEE